MISKGVYRFTLLYLSFVGLFSLDLYCQTYPMIPTFPSNNGQYRGFQYGNNQSQMRPHDPFEIYNSNQSNGALMQQYDPNERIFNETKRRYNEETLREIYEEERRNNPPLNPFAINFKIPEFIKETKGYEEANLILNQMLIGKRPISIKDACYYFETAVAPSYISYEDYCKTIKESASFIKKWLVQNKVSLKANEGLNYGVQQFMSAQLSITLPSLENKLQIEKKYHEPYFYDYKDFKGKEDIRNSFVTKSIATGSGQCHSMTLTYLLLAEAIGAKASMSLAPHHSFIKYPDSKGKVLSYEPTTNWHITDRWYQEYMYVTAEGKRSGLYLSRLSKKQLVGDILAQLTKIYMIKYRIGRPGLIQKNIEALKTIFPKNNNLEYIKIQEGYLGEQINIQSFENNLKSLDAIKQHKSTSNLYKAYVTLVEQQKLIGFTDVSEYIYETMMKENVEKASRQEAEKKDGKQKRNLFTNEKNNDK